MALSIQAGLLCFLFLFSFPRGNASPTKAVVADVSPSPIASAVVDGVTYLNKGLVGFGLIPANFQDSTGDTMGGIGSAIALKFGTWNARSDGTFTGTLIVHPDRGFNVITTVDYQSRQHEIDFVLTPYTSSANLNFTFAQKTLQLNYTRTTLQFDRQNTKTSGLDPTSIRAAQPGFPFVPFADPQMPIASITEQHLVIDAEGIVANPDGTFWVSDEYGPYIYRFASDGNLIQTIQPPNAFLPRDASGNLNFTSEVDPATGRVGNQGFEGLSFDVGTGTLFAMLQSATVQDGGSDKSTSRFTRLLAYDVANPASAATQIGEWIVPLPQSSKGKTEASSEIHFVSPGIFMSLSRDADGRGGSDNKSSYKHVDLFSTSKATNIQGTFDDPAKPSSPGGVLDPSIVPANYVSFVDLLDTKQLARFGLHNGSPDDSTLIDAKWESIALAPVDDQNFPDDYFLFVASDNDFLTTQGISLGVPYNAGIDVDNQFLVFRLTLPSVSQENIRASLGI